MYWSAKPDAAYLFSAAQDAASEPMSGTGQKVCYLN